MVIKQWHLHDTGSCTSGGRWLIIRGTLYFSSMSLPLGHTLIKQCCNTHTLLWHWWVMAFTKEDELHVCADWDEHLFLRDWLLTFCSAICADVPSKRLDRAHHRGALQHAHLPLSPQFAVPCGAPDVACRIIHTHALMKVSIWPRMHTLSPQNQICMGKLEKKTTTLQSWERQSRIREQTFRSFYPWTVPPAHAVPASKDLRHQRWFSNHSERLFRAFFCRSDKYLTYFEDGQRKGLIASEGLTQ